MFLIVLKVDANLSLAFMGSLSERTSYMVVEIIQIDRYCKLRENNIAKKIGVNIRVINLSDNENIKIVSM